MTHTMLLNRWKSLLDNFRRPDKVYSYICQEFQFLEVSLNGSLIRPVLSCSIVRLELRSGRIQQSSSNDA